LDECNHTRSIRCPFLLGKPTPNAIFDRKPRTFLRRGSFAGGNWFERGHICSVQRANGFGTDSASRSHAIPDSLGERIGIRTQPAHFL
jgi:hypothetical protein